MSVYVESRGQGPSLVLLHGWGMNGAVWQGLASRLESDFRLHLVDLPGFGHSPALPRSARLNDWVNAVLEVVPSQAAWLGWSLGGLLATQAALLAPSRVSHLVTLASTPCFVAESAWPGIKPEVLATFEQQLVEDHHTVINRFLALQAMGSEHAREDIRQLKASLAAKPSPDPVALAAGLALLGEVDLRARLGELQLPVLRLYGRLDGLVPKKVIPLVAALLPENLAHSHSHVEAKASHAAFISHPDTTAERIKNFLQQAQT
ncbi:pimeloyl-[acyl-carrier protein] methyl ester esterase [Oceanisphaera marina]|uniref:Pimeloyl-[acyl-carrier protein] methyl ester esterase n=1 Tax=Oceanisphaera marina TaxID=2017550 RepID=A0ABQ1IGL1_9GAMM|nr:pimeloyl-ACP methyl ester esterase BioH [Oceanisphaera marina]GGB40470.1 pimeloyl-[acyl-carrier protein] methyl ester esterase [Oceanisphaera marina]